MEPGITKLCQWLRRAGVITISSCSGHGEREPDGYIVMKHEGADLLVTILHHLNAALSRNSLDLIKIDVEAQDRLVLGETVNAVRINLRNFGLLSEETQVRFGQELLNRRDI